MRWLLLLVALFGFASQAQAEETTPDWVGVWEGTIGNLPIRVCFDDNGLTTGTYYYLKHLKPIALRPDEQETKGVLVESLSYDDPTGGVWTLTDVSPQELSGRWRNARNSLPISLKPVPYSEQPYAGPCEAAEFLAPRMAGGEIKESEGKLGDLKYTRLTYVPGPQFNRDAASVESFALHPIASGDAAINHELRKALPDGS